MARSGRRTLSATRASLSASRSRPGLRPALRHVSLAAAPSPVPQSIKLRARCVPLQPPPPPFGPPACILPTIPHLRLRHASTCKSAGAAGAEHPGVRHSAQPLPMRSERLRHSGLLQDGITGVPAGHALRHREGLPRDGRVPKLMAALGRAKVGASCVQ